MSAAIEIREVSKRYGAHTVVDALSLYVEPGEIYGFLGLNGAGKTTTIRMMLGMVKPTAGNIAILGTPVGARTTGVWASVGHLVETAAAYPELTVREKLLGIPGWSGALVLHAAGRFFAAAALTVVLCTTFGFAASAGRGYLASVGSLFAVVFCAQILAALGLGPLVPVLGARPDGGVAGSAGTQIGPVSYLMVVATGASAVVATMMWWHRVDQT